MTLIQALLLSQLVSGEAVLRVILKERGPRPYHTRLALRKWLIEEIIERRAFGADLSMRESRQEKSVETRWPEVDEPLGNPVYLVRCQKQSGFCTVGNRDVCKVDPWDPARVLKDTGKTPLDQVYGCQAGVRALTIHRPRLLAAHVVSKGPKIGQIDSG